MQKKRNRLLYFLLIVVTLLVGLQSRKDFIPGWLLPYLGDVLYTLMFYFAFAFLFPRMPAYKVAILSIGLCFFIELTQLYQGAWLNEIRQNRLGGLILGFGFRWSDLLCYSLGGGIGYGIEQLGVKKFGL